MVDLCVVLVAPGGVMVLPEVVMGNGDMGFGCQVCCVCVCDMFSFTCRLSAPLVLFYAVCSFAFFWSRCVCVCVLSVMVCLPLFV